MTGNNIQLDAKGRLKHFLTIEGIDRSLLLEILDYAESFAVVGERAVKKVPLLRGKTIANLFFEPSTRTRTTFELAAKRLSADVLNLNILSSATKKGETLLDTLQTLEAMHCDMFIIRHPNNGNLECCEIRFMFADSKHIQHRLSGMCMATITSVNHPYMRRYLRSNKVCCSTIGMANDKHITMHGFQRLQCV